MDKIIIGQTQNIINWNNIFEIRVINPPWAKTANHSVLEAITPYCNNQEFQTSYLYEGHVKNANEVHEYLLAKLIDPQFILINLNECINQLRPLDYWEDKENPTYDTPF